jgi:uncharacterized protein
VFVNQEKPLSRTWTYLRLAARIALFVGIFILLDKLTDVVASHWPALDVVQPVAPLVGLVHETLSLITVLCSTLIMAAIERRPFRDYGYKSEHVASRFGVGLICGLLVLTGMIGGMHYAGAIHFTGVNQLSITLLRDGTIWAVVFLMIGFSEESIFRGYLQHTLTRDIGFWWAAVLVSGAFIIWHIENEGETLLGLLATGLASFAFSLSLWYTRSLWWAIGFHTGWDWGESFLYGTPDSAIVTRGSLFTTKAIGPAYLSGGAVGPEGSALLIPCFVLVISAMWLAWSPRSPLRRRANVPNAVRA